MKCEECGKKNAQFALFRSDGKKKEWVNVCKHCEGKIAHNNLQLVGGLYTLKTGVGQYE